MVNKISLIRNIPKYEHFIGKINENLPLVITQ